MRSDGMAFQLLLFLVATGSVRCLDMNINNKHHAALGACQACKTVVKSFNAAMEKTARGKHEGGDADWESKKLKNYAHSEIRLAEIQSLLCSDIVVGKSQCHDVAAESEEAIESEWWPADPRPDLHVWLCIERRRACCPAGHFGPTCQPCTGGAESPCSGRGHCKGDGTRKGSGTCVCNTGYSGTLCDTCNSTSHYTAFQDESKLVCSPCHQSCHSACTGAGPKLCVRCGSGYEWDAELGCSDINECESSPCRPNQLCINDPGKYTCMDCDKACASCHGDGPDMCHQCADGYVQRGKFCVDAATVTEPESDATGTETESDSTEAETESDSTDAETDPDVTVTETESDAAKRKSETPGHSEL